MYLVVFQHLCPVLRGVPPAVCPAVYQSSKVAVVRLTPLPDRSWCRVSVVLLDELIDIRFCYLASVIVARFPGCKLVVGSRTPRPAITFLTQLYTSSGEFLDPLPPR